MYHVGNSKRSYDCANLIYEGIRQISETKSIDNITITDIQKAVGVARSSFYRSFDNINDVLDWKVNVFYQVFIEKHMNIYKPKSHSDMTILLLQYYDQNSDLPIFLSNNKKLHILENAFDMILKKYSTDNNVNLSPYTATLCFYLPLIMIECKEKNKYTDSPEQIKQIIYNEMIKFFDN